MHWKKAHHHVPGNTISFEQHLDIRKQRSQACFAHACSRVLCLMERGMWLLRRSPPFRRKCPSGEWSFGACKVLKRRRTAKRKQRSRDTLQESNFQAAPWSLGTHVGVGRLLGDEDATDLAKLLVHLPHCQQSKKKHMGHGRNLSISVSLPNVACLSTGVNMGSCSYVI